MKKDLLDELAQNLGCPYLSELRYVNRNSAVFKQCINGIEYDTYSLAEWTNAVKYIAEDDKLLFANEDEARVYILSKPKKWLFG